MVEAVAPIKAGETIFISSHTVNRDRLENPNELNIHRKGINHFALNFKRMIFEQIKFKLIILNQMTFRYLRNCFPQLIKKKLITSSVYICVHIYIRI